MVLNSTQRHVNVHLCGQVIDVIYALLGNDMPLGVSMYSPPFEGAAMRQGQL